MAAQAPGGAISLDAEAGFDGYAKPDHWIPVYIDVANTGAPIEGELVVAALMPGQEDAAAYRAPISLPTQSRKRVSLLVFVNAFATDVSVQLQDEDGRVVAQTPEIRLRQLSGDDLLYGVISSAPGELSLLESFTADRQNAAVGFLDLQDLPESAAAWRALDILVLDDVDTSRLTVKQRLALDDWLAGGGQMVVTGGSGWQQTARPLEEYLPLTPTSTLSFEDLPLLRAAAGESFRDPGPYLVAAGDLVEGEALIAEGEIPLLARRPHGRGAAYFLALDPKAAPLLDWSGARLVWERVAGGAPQSPPWGRGISNNFAAVEAVNSIPSLALPSAAWLIAFLLIYTLVIGPLNYLALRQWGRREWAWITVPLISLLFAGLTYFVGFQIRGNDVLLNQVHVAYGQLEAERIQVDSVFGLYSPRRAEYELSIADSEAMRPFTADFRAPAFGNRLRTVQQSPGVTISGIRTDVSEVVTFIANSQQEAPQLSGQARLLTDGDRSSLEAEFSNSSSVAFENLSLMLGNDVWSLGDLSPGESIQFAQPLTDSPPGPVSPIFSTLSFPGSLLGSNAEKILGSADFYNDESAYARWQTLQAIEGNGLGDQNLIGSRGTATIIAWSDQEQIQANLDSAFESASTSLYFLELPVEISLNVESEIPRSFVSATILDSRGIVEPSGDSFYLGQGEIELEFRPWSQFAGQEMIALEIVLNTPFPGQEPPQVSLWNWADGVWVALPDQGWGTTPVSAPERFVNGDNALRARLANSGTGVELQAFYPLIRIKGTS